MNLEGKAEQIFTMDTGETAIELCLNFEERDQSAESDLIKLSGSLPWLGEKNQYFPEEIIGVTLWDTSQQEFSVVKVEYDLSPCGHRYVKYVWVKPI